MPVDAALPRHRIDGVDPSARPGGAHSQPDSRMWSQRVDRRRQCVVVRVEGEIDALVHDRFRETVEHATRAGCQAVVVDLRAARFLSIRTASALGTLRQRAACAGVDLRVVAGRAEIERALDVAGVRSLFFRYPSMRAALDA